MERFVCPPNKCTGCKACISVCTQNALSFTDTIVSNQVKIDSEKCIGCNACYKVCQGINPISLSSPVFWTQGWARQDIREQSSSGGFAYQIMKLFVDSNSYVCSCIFNEGLFEYTITNNPDELLAFVGSKYVKSNPSDIYKKVIDLLRMDNKVLFIGLPCHVGALKKYLGGRFEQQLYTIDLICHGTPSPLLLTHYLHELKYNSSEINSIKFRNKNSFGLIIDSKKLTIKGTLDSYTIGFLNGLFYTENCYQCHYAQFDRVSDITLGDSWGTDLLNEKQGGISLALCQTEKGKHLLLSSGLVLHDVNIQKAVEANGQLTYPAKLINERGKFFAILDRTGSFSKAVFACFPKQCLKQLIKGVLISLHLLKR